jgi:hypothetical protein
MFICASARISKGQGYQGFLRKRAGSSFGPKKCNLRCTRKNFKNEKNGQNFTPFLGGQGAPWEVKGHPLEAAGHGAPSKNA